MESKSGQKELMEIRKLHLALADIRGITKTYCPSEIAKAFRPESWRNHMDIVRDIADDLVGENKLVVMQKGNIISNPASLAKGPIRLRKKGDTI